MERLLVLYDEDCGFCCQCVRWLSKQAQAVPLQCAPRQAPEVQATFGHLDKPGTKPELVVVDSDGGVYRDADAWIVTLWALKDYRGWSRRLARPGLRPFARALFELVSNNRQTVSKVMMLESDVVLQQRLARFEPSPWSPKCEGAACVTR